MFYLLIKRELKIFRNTWLKNLMFWFFSPAFILLTIVIPIYNILPTLTLNYLYWSIPGICLLVSIIVTIDRSIKKIIQLLSPNNPDIILLKSPVAIWKIIMNICFISILFGSVQSIISIIVLNMINQGVYTLMQHFNLFVHIVVLLFFFSVLGILIGFILPNMENISFILIIIFSIIGFIFGSLIPIELFSDQLSTVLLKIPIVAVIINAQNIYSLNSIKLFPVFFMIILSIVFQLINIIIGYKVLRK